MWPLQDITIYYLGEGINDSPNGQFRKTANFIADFYHNRLDGYKPPKTARICIHFSEKNPYSTPFYFGAICTYGIQIDEGKYNKLEYNQQRQYILDLLHTAVMELADGLGWNKEVFERAYNHIISNTFSFQKFYPAKLSRDRRHSACALIEKTLDKSVLHLVIAPGEAPKQMELLEKKNWYWYDSIYWLAASCKWIDKHSFGIMDKDKNRYAYYSLMEGKVVTNMNFSSNDF